MAGQDQAIHYPQSGTPAEQHLGSNNGRVGGTADLVMIALRVTVDLSFSGTKWVGILQFYIHHGAKDLFMSDQVLGHNCKGGNA